MLSDMSNLANQNTTVIVGMSGGVDSSVSALLLKQQGYRVIGVFMKNWEEDDASGICQASKDFDDVALVCEQIGIPYYSVNFAKEYWNHVFSHCLEEYKAGYTPNPDILCNREIKFKAFFNKAMELGGDFLATGHYCRTGMVAGEQRLLRGLDGNKDQSYFLYTLKSQILEKVMFPIGHLPKSEVRRIALEYDLATAKKKDSTGICFIGKRNFKDFLGQYIPTTPGNFENLHGEIVGVHDGIAFYTIGQRKGLKIGGAGDAWYVVGKEINRNVVIVDQGPEQEALFGNSLTAVDVSWVGNSPTSSLRCTAKIRYRHDDAPCVVEVISPNLIKVQFDTPQRAITPRQSIVFYDGEICLGGAIVQQI